MRIAIALSMLAMLLSTSEGAFGWAAPGHQTVGAIADDLIAGTPTAKKVRKILGTTLRTASVWADCAKSVTRKPDGSFVYQAEPAAVACRPFENPASEKLLVDFVKRNWDNCRPAPGDEVCHKQYHYADVAIERDAYSPNLVGASDHDVVAAIAAAVAVLQGQAAPTPFELANKKEALRVLSHYVGDIHQPLHVAAVYLSVDGAIVDPDAGTFDRGTKTIGGNALVDHGANFHMEWDDVPASLDADHLTPAILQQAGSVSPTTGPVATWSASWATDSLTVGKTAFADLTYSSEDSTRHWQVTVPPNYGGMRVQLQQQQLIKAGARLAQLLRTVFP